MWLTIASTSTPGGAAPVVPLLESGSLVIGRAPDCDLVLDDPTVSKQHARLDVDAGEVWLTDLGSSNGTLLDGRRVVRPRPLQSGSRLQVGATVIRLSADRPGGGTAATPSCPPPARRATAPTAGAVAYDVSNAGPVAGGDVRMTGERVAGRDLVIHEGFRLQSRLRGSAKACIRLGCVLMVAGFGTFGYFILAWNSSIFGVLSEPGGPFGGAEPSSGTDPFAEPDLPSPLPWLPLGAGMMFVGMALLVTGLLIPRHRVLIRDGR